MPDDNCVYILASDRRRLYISVTSDLARRLREHRMGCVDSFTRKYRIWKLVHLECGGSREGALAREKELKGWRREKKIALIERENFGWLDLAPGLGIAEPVPEAMSVWLGGVFAARTDGGR